MGRSLSFLCVTLLAAAVPLCQSFAAKVPSSIRTTATSATSSKSQLWAAAEEAGCTTESKENYDIVKVDLSDGRDYPIYIGTGYEDKEGASRFFIYGVVNPFSYQGIKVALKTAFCSRLLLLFIFFISPLLSPGNLLGCSLLI